MPRSHIALNARPPLDTRNGDRFRRFALALPGAHEGSHMGHADFRVQDCIFATLAYELKGKGTLKLTPQQQAEFCSESPELFEPAPGGWGRMGMTLLRLDLADDALMQGALRTAHHNVLSTQAERPAKRRRKPSAP